MKKKVFTKKISLLLICIMAVCFVGCGSNNSGAGDTEATPSPSASSDTAPTGGDTGTQDDVVAGSETGMGNDSASGNTANADTSDVNGAGTLATGTAQASEANPINDRITGWYSETLRYPILEDEIVDELNYENLDLSNTRYYYNFVDLNGDKKDEIIVQLVGEYSTTDDGDTLLIVEQKKPYSDDEDDGFDIKEQYTGFVNPVIISDHTTNGYKDIIFMNKDGKSYSKIVYKDDGYQKMSDAEKLDNINDVSGVALLCNDIAADAENNTGLYFSN